MPYLDRIIQPGERVVAIGQLHWIIYLPAIVPGAAGVLLAIWTGFTLPPHDVRLPAFALAGVLVAVAIVQFLSRYVIRLTTEYAVTNQRVIRKTGLLSLHTVEINLDRIESVDVDQSLLGRMLGFGTVTIHGTGSRWDPLRNLADPLAFRNAISAR